MGTPCLYMATAHISGGLISLAASAIYTAGYLRTQSADSASGDFGVSTPLAETTATVALTGPAGAAAIVVDTSTASRGVISDQEV
jgi:hypothetical protein